MRFGNGVMKQNFAGKAFGKAKPGVKLGKGKGKGKGKDGKPKFLGPKDKKRITIRMFAAQDQLEVSREPEWDYATNDWSIPLGEVLGIEETFQCDEDGQFYDSIGEPVYTVWIDVGEPGVTVEDGRIFSTEEAIRMASGDCDEAVPMATVEEVTVCQPCAAPVSGTTVVQANRTQEAPPANSSADMGQSFSATIGGFDADALLPNSWQSGKSCRVVIDLDERY